MPVRIFAGDAEAVAQVDDGEITAYDAATTYTVTINGKTVETLGTGGTVSTTAVALAALLEASTIPEFAEVTWTNPSVGEITATADTAGKPFTATLTVSGGTGTVDDFSSTTANDGPNVWSANNFKTAGVRGTLPTAGDTVIIEQSSVDLLYNLDQNAAGDITLLEIRASYEGTIGLPQTNTDGSTDYSEYRERYLVIEGSAIDIGDGAGNGSEKIRLSLNGTADSCVVHSTGQSTDDHGALEIDGNGQTITALTVLGGTVDVARDDATAGATVTTLVYDTGSVVFVDSNCTLATVNAQGGTLTADTAITTITITQGTYRHTTGNITTANPLGGILLFANPLAITVTNVNMGTAGGVAADPAAADITFSNYVMAAGQTHDDPDGHISFAGGTTGGALLSELGLNVGRGRVITIA